MAVLDVKFPDRHIAYNSEVLCRLSQPRHGVCAKNCSRFPVKVASRHTQLQGYRKLGFAAAASKVQPDNTPLFARSAQSQHVHRGAAAIGCKKRVLLLQPRELTQDVSESMEVVLDQHARRIAKVAKDLQSPKKYGVFLDQSAACLCRETASTNFYCLTALNYIAFFLVTRHSS